uniref:CD109-like molecule n=1 Tax=Diadumene lineata TaxID=1789172 RepID=D4QA02_9CNID|nr:CD109-like molecule [Diadumene lineata]
MEIQRVLGCTFFAIFCSSLVNQVTSTYNQSYLILSPKVFWSGRPLTLKVTIIKTSSPVSVTASIVSGYMHEPPKMVSSANGTFNAGTADLTIEVPSGLSHGGYRLMVNGSGGLTFYNESYLTFRSKGMSIYVQMDKGIYKPGQKVQMRIFALLPNLKSYDGKMTVDILDPNENKMAHWPNIRGYNGIIKKEFLLSTQPVMGMWKVMVVAANGEKSSKTFEVKEYVLPKFDVTVNTPPYVLKGDQSVLIKVNSKYTYGKGVKGQVVISGYFQNWAQPENLNCFQKSQKIDGHASVQVSMEDIKGCFFKTFNSFVKTYSNVDKYMFQYSWYRMVVNTTVTEELTGKTYSGQAELKFYYSIVKLDFPSFNPTSYKPGLDFVTMLKVTEPNGEPLKDPKILNKLKVTIKTTYQSAGPSYERRMVVDAYSPSPDGIILIKRKVPDQSVSSISMQAEYQVDDNYKENAYFNAYQAESPSDSYIQLTTTSPSVKSGEKINCKVISSFPVSSYIYLVMARGQIRKRQSGSVSNSAKEFTFDVLSIPEMAPNADIVVYTIRKDGEVVVDSLSVTVENPFENEVSVKFSRDKSGPGDQINLVGKATPGSHMAFLVVDKSVLLMKKDNDLNRDEILQDLQSYSTSSSWYPWWDWNWFSPRRSRRMIMPFPTSGRDAMSIFQDAGLIVFSDCLVYKRKNYYDNGPYPYMENSMAAGADGAGGGVLRKGSGSGKNLAPVTKIRSLFPETWIFMDVNASSSGEASISTSVPDTITSWVASAFAISPNTGFGIGATKPKLQVFQPFFISLDLPYSIVRGEEVAIKALVFNYQEQPQEVTVTFKGSKDFAAINELSSPRGNHEQESVDIQEVLTIPAGEGRAVAFPIKPKTLGKIPIIVQAQSEVASDAVKRTILVKPEGVPNSYSYSVMIDLNTTSTFTKTLDLALPKSAVKGSAYAKVTIIGDILGSSLNNLDDLLRMPYGCGEQNMVNFAPNIYVLKYLTAVNKVTPAIKSKAENYMVQGYQREQTYRHRDGSYSAFGERDPEGSMWLTAFVVKSFAQARKYIYVDPESLDLSLNFMANKQNRDGSFPTLGKVHGSYLKGGNQGEWSLSAFVVIALAEANSNDKGVMLAKKKGIEYLNTNLDKIVISGDIYALTLVTYALRLVQHPSSNKALSKLMTKAIRKDGMMYWTNADKDEDKSTAYRPYYQPRSADVEMTSYVLLTLSLDKDIKNGLPVVRWLSLQRNSLGGYSSTQDTVLGIQAMSEFAALIYSSSQAFEVQLSQSAVEGFSETIKVDASNAMVLQEVLLSTVEGSLTISASGRGIGMLQVGVTYHVEKVKDKPDFNFVVEILKEGNYEIETVSCARWEGDGDSSDMAVMELGIASGFSPSQDAIEKLLNDKGLAVKRIDNEDKKTIIYFDKIGKKEKTCIKMLYERTHPVGKGQPVPAVVYDYYNPEFRAEALYSSDKLQNNGVCRVCPMCINCDHKVKPVPGPVSFSSRLTINVTVLLVCALLALLSMK